MNKILKYGLMAFAFAVTAVSCTDEYEYDPAKPFKANDYSVSFVSHTDRVAIAEEEDGFTVTLMRENTDGELTVPLNVKADKEIEVEPTAVFANGSQTAEVKVKLSQEAILCKKYELSISIPDEYKANPYSEETLGYPTFFTNVLREDYQVVARGIFAENILFRQRWYQNLEYSKTLGVYRMPDLIVEGYHFYFKWDGTTNEDQTFYFCDADGDEVSTMATGYVHPSYGMISATPLSGYFTGYDVDDTFYFPFSMDVSAGSFGQNYDTLQILEWYNTGEE